MSLMIFLRPLVLSDARISYQWRNQPEIWKFTRFHPAVPVTLEMELSWLAAVLERKDQQRFAICLKRTGKYLGNVQLINILNGEAEFHLFIGDTRYWGKGIGEAAADLMLRYAFFELGLQYITLEVDQENLAAVKVYQRLGFAVAGSNNQYTIMGLKKETYEKHNHTVSKGTMDGLFKQVSSI